ncbi:MAG TPA: hypothetical protein DCZ23_08380 [Lachnospiraceae bacterium]|nr:hypothetical protein [Lachnospiraceae bacterium]
MRYYHYGYKNNSKSSDEENTLNGCFITETDINKKTVYNSSLVIEDDTVYEIDEECMKCRK